MLAGYVATLYVKHFKILLSPHAVIIMTSVINLKYSEITTRKLLGLVKKWYIPLWYFSEISNYSNNKKN